jgi:hypothetical protein
MLIFSVSFQFQKDKQASKQVEFQKDKQAGGQANRMINSRKTNKQASK